MEVRGKVLCQQESASSVPEFISPLRSGQLLSKVLGTWNNNKKPPKIMVKGPRVHITVVRNLKQDLTQMSTLLLFQADFA
jgi:hypothetical protein